MTEPAWHHPNPEIELVPVSDPNEGAFTVELPRGWQNQAVMVRPYGLARTLVTAQSPDGLLYLFLGDPQLPDFSEPMPGLFPGLPMPSMNPLMQVQPYVPAEPFFVRYLQGRYGHAPGFRITGGAPCPRIERIDPSVQANAQAFGMHCRITSISLSFEYQDMLSGGRQMHGRLHGLTFSLGETWVPQVCGFLSAGGADPASYDELLFRVQASARTNPQWRQRQDQLHQQQMAQNQWNQQAQMQQMQQTHQNNMNWIQQSAQSHQARMDTLHASQDAQFQSWRAQQAATDDAHRAYMNTVNQQNVAPPSAGGGSGDFNHRRFTNYITEQETVVGPDGSTYQVDGGHERYYKHKYDDTYVGTDYVTERDDLRTRFGVNPDDYEEVRIKR